MMESPERRSEHSKSPADILIVDDVPQNLNLLNYILTRAGYSVRVAGDKTTHRVRPDFDFCKECKTHACGARMASVLRR